MDVAAPLPALCGKHLDHGHDIVINLFLLGKDIVFRDDAKACLGGYLVRRLLRDVPEAGMGKGYRRLDVEEKLDAGVLFKDRSHMRRTVPVIDGVDHGNATSCMPLCRIRAFLVFLFSRPPT